MTGATEKISNILRNAKGNSLDIFYTLYREYMSKSDAPHEVLCQILQYVEPVGTEDDEQARYISQETAENIYDTYYGLLCEIVRIIVKKNKTIEDFYKELYEAVFSDNALYFPKDDETRAVLLSFLSKNILEIPYFQAESLLQMTNEDYKDAVDRLMPFVCQAVHMLNRPFNRKTEVVSQLWRIAKQIEKDSDQIVYWAIVIGIIGKASEDRD